MAIAEKSILAEQHRKDICVEYFLELHQWQSIKVMADWYQMNVNTLRQMIAEGDELYNSSKQFKL